MKRHVVYIHLVATTTSYCDKQENPCHFLSQHDENRACFSGLQSFWTLDLLRSWRKSSRSKINQPSWYRDRVAQKNKVNKDRKPNIASNPKNSNPLNPEIMNKIRTTKKATGAATHQPVRFVSCRRRTQTPARMEIRARAIVTIMIFQIDTTVLL